MEFLIATQYIIMMREANKVKIRFAIITLGFALLPLTSFAVDNMHWSPRMFVSGGSASLGDLMDMARIVDNKNKYVYSSYYNYDTHSEKNVYIENNDITSTGGSVAYGADGVGAVQPKIQDGGKVSWEWEFK
jgi:hypothetical protein